MFGAKLPADFGRWCLDQAVGLAHTKPEIAEHLLLEAHRELKSRGVSEGLSMEILQGRVRGNAALQETLDQVLAPAPSREDDGPWRQHQAAYAAERERERRDLLKNFRSHERTLFENRAHPEVLHQLALVYFGEGPDADSGMLGADAIAITLGNSGAVDAALHGLRHCADRDDLPSARAVIRLARRKRESYISLPLLAGLLERQESSPKLVLEMDTSNLRTCVACLHCWEPHFAHPKGGNPAWYQAALDGRPEIVSEVAVLCATGALRSNGVISPRFWSFLGIQGNSPLARGAVLDLLRALPTRCNARQLDVLDELLWTGLRLGLRSELMKLASQRLSRKGLDVGQKVRWMGLGLICDPAGHAEILDEAVRANERLARHLARFLVHPEDGPSSIADPLRHVIQALDPPSLALIVGLIGPFFAPYKPVGFATVPWFLHRVIDWIGSRPSRSASQSLESLLDDPGLSEWRTLLSGRREAQRRLRRDFDYVHPTPEQVCETMKGGRPANACDLAELTHDTLQGLAHRI